MTVVPFGDYKRIFGFCIPYLQEYATYTFSSLGSEYSYANDALFLAPLLLFFFLKKREARLMLWFYLIQWLVLFAFAVYMRRFPFMRNTGGLVTLSLIITLYTFHLLGEWLQHWTRIRYFATISMTLAVGLLMNHFWYTNTDFFHERIYNYQTNERHDIITQNLGLFPKGTSIGLSDEGFYWYYVFQKNKIPVSLCLDGSEAYLIKQYDEPCPTHVKIDDYELVSKFDVYEIYRRKK